jgi:hypothetical protein
LAEIAGWLFAIPVPFLLMNAPRGAWIVLANLLLGVNQDFCDCENHVPADLPPRPLSPDVKRVLREALTFTDQTAIMRCARFRSALARLGRVRC